MSEVKAILSSNRLVTDRSACSPGSRRTYPRARALWDEHLAIRRKLANWREIGHKSGLVDSLRGTGDVARLEGDLSLVDACLAESLALCRENGARDGEARALQSLAELSRGRQEITDAATTYRQALELWKEMEHLDGIAGCLRGPGEIAAVQGSFERAARLFGAAETLMERVGRTCRRATARTSNGRWRRPGPD